MQFINIKDHKTGDTVKALNFGGPKCYKVSNRFVWAPSGGTNLTINENSITLEPLGLVINNPNIWTIVSHQSPGTVNWRVTVKNLATGEEKANVYPFKFNGNVYELECQPGTWVMASCGGYKIESSWEGKQNYEAFRLKGTGEIIKILTMIVSVSFYAFRARSALNFATGFVMLGEDVENPYVNSYAPRGSSIGYSSFVETPLYNPTVYSFPFARGYTSVNSEISLTVSAPYGSSGQYETGTYDFSKVSSWAEDYYANYVQNMNSIFPYKGEVIIAVGQGSYGSDKIYLNIYGKLKLNHKPYQYGYDVRMEMNYVSVIFLNLYQGAIEELNSLSLDEALFRFGIDYSMIHGPNITGAGY